MAMFSEFSQLMEEWDYDLNTLDPKKLKSGSKKRAHWVCKDGHKWQTPIVNRTRTGTGCRECWKKNHAKQQLMRSVERNGSVLNSSVINEWDYDKNTMIPQETPVTYTSKVWWKCASGHSWDSTPNGRIGRGWGCPFCTSKRVIDDHYTSRAMAGISFLTEASKELLAEWDYSANEKTPDMFLPSSHHKAHWVCGDGHKWAAAIGNRMVGRGCPKCFYIAGPSKMESELHEFVKSLLPDNSVKSSTRSVIPPYELDLYIQELDISIEFNGLYWHSEKILNASRKIGGKEYHHAKWKMCHDKGIQLITVWEDDWRDNREAIESMLKHKIGVSKLTKVMARKTEFVTVKKADAKAFLETHHIQGYKSMTTSYGLKERSTGELVAIMSFSVNGGVATLDRYATSAIVSGGFTKLLKAAIKELPETVTRIISFSDNEVSDGSMYVNNGFHVEAELSPDYKYVYGNKRHHKFLFRKKRFKEDPALKYEESMTERELAEINGINRVWDSGKIRWAMEINHSG